MCLHEWIAEKTYNKIVFGIKSMSWNGLHAPGASQVKTAKKVGISTTGKHNWSKKKQQQLSSNSIQLFYFDSDWSR